MAKTKFYTREKEINGVKYVAQYSGLKTAMRMVDECYVNDNSRNMSPWKVAEYVFKNVIVEPTGLSIDDFDDMDELNEVVNWASEVAQGNFRDEEKDESTNKGTSKK